MSISKLLKTAPVLFIFFIFNSNVVVAACNDNIEYFGNNDVYEKEFGLRAPGVTTLYSYSTDGDGVILPSCPIEADSANKLIIPVLLVDWADYDPSVDLSNPNNPDSGGNSGYVRATKETISDFLNGSNGPAQYYKDVSGGQFNIEFDVIDWISSSAPNSYLKNRADYLYQANGGTTWFCKRDDVMRDVLKSAVSVHGVDFTIYDIEASEHTNLNKIVDAPILMYEGDSGLCNGTNMSWLDGSSLEAEDSVSGFFAVGLTKLVDLIDQADPNFNLFNTQNALFNFYVSVPESSASSFNGPSNGSLVHEIGHLVLGFVDYYFTDQNIYGWALSGSIGRIPSHPAAWEKWLFGGWINPVEVTESGTYVLDANDAPDGSLLEGSYLYRIPIADNDNQYLTIEYRWFEEQGNTTTQWATNTWASGSLRESGLQIVKFDWSQSAFDITNAVRQNPERAGSPSETYSYGSSDEFYQCYADDLCITINNILLNNAQATFDVIVIIDSDRDGCSNSEDLFPEDPTECTDNDSDGIGDNADPDDDNDGVLDADDAFPLDASEQLDTDMDGIGNNADPDDDNDGVLDVDDAFPLDASEQLDTDMDGIGNNADPDDDNDGMTDSWEVQYGLDPLNAGDASTDLDGDGVSNLAEFQNGTNPTQAPSAPSATPSSGGGGGSIGWTMLLFILATSVVRWVLFKDKYSNTKDMSNFD